MQFLQTKEIGRINARYVIRWNLRPQGDYEVEYLAGTEVRLTYALGKDIDEMLNGPQMPC